MEWKQNEKQDVISSSIHDGDGMVTRRRFFRDTTRLPIRIEVWELPPGGSEGDHVHEGDEALEEFYYFIEGHGIMWMGDEEFSVRPGDAVMAPPGVPHGFRSVGDDTLKLLILWGAPITS